MKAYHESDESHHFTQAKQFNCDDCPFQGENSLELKTHIRRTKNVSSDVVETFYTCKIEFNNYWQLMNHRKLEHPSRRRCRYFLKNECEFDEKKCWYKHDDVIINLNENLTAMFECNECKITFTDKPDLMKHKKYEHRDKVSMCRGFENCNVDEKDCWFLHKEVDEEREGS